MSRFLFSFLWALPQKNEFLLFLFFNREWRWLFMLQHINIFLYRGESKNDAIEGRTYQSINKRKKKLSSTSWCFRCNIGNVIYVLHKLFSINRNKKIFNFFFPLFIQIFFLSSLFPIHKSNGNFSVSKIVQNFNERKQKREIISF